MDHFGEVGSIANLLDSSQEIGPNQQVDVVMAAGAEIRRIDRLWGPSRVIRPRRIDGLEVWLYDFDMPPRQVNTS